MLVFQALILERSLIYLKYCTKVVTPKRKDTSFVAGTPNCDSLIFLHCYMNKIEKKKKKEVCKAQDRLPCLDKRRESGDSCEPRHINNTPA